jgi:hypothetical protein
MLWQNFKDFFGQPWKGATEMSAFDWFLFFGLIIVLLALWRIIFTHIEELTP